MSQVAADFTRGDVVILKAGYEIQERMIKWIEKLGHAIKEDARIKQISSDTFENFLSSPDGGFSEEGGWEVDLLARAAVDSIRFEPKHSAPGWLIVPDEFGNESEINVAAVMTKPIPELVEKIVAAVEKFEAEHGDDI